MAGPFGRDCLAVLDPHRIGDVAQLAQFEGRFEILLLMLVKEIKGWQACWVRIGV